MKIIIIIIIIIIILWYVLKPSVSTLIPMSTLYIHSLHCLTLCI